MNSLNNRIVVETYKSDRSLQTNVKNGFATVAQKQILKGLRVLVDAKLSDGTHIPAGSVAYIREELLHAQAWAQKKYTCDTLPGEFMVVDSTNVEFFDQPNQLPVA